jgi:hypothetical protein
MRRYLTRRCIGLHLVALILVPAFLYAGWWQYQVAESGNALSWVYTVEWPAFAVYAVYMWWKLIHDQHTPFDRLWAAKQRAAADASGRPLYEIPGWAMDKTLSKAVFESSRAAARALELSDGKKTRALESQDQKFAHAIGLTAAFGDSGNTIRGHLPSQPVNDVADEDAQDFAGQVIDARVLDVKVVEDEELDEDNRYLRELNKYNRYLADLSWRDPPKHWGVSRNREH